VGDRAHRTSREDRQRAHVQGRHGCGSTGGSGSPSSTSLGSASSKAAIWRALASAKSPGSENGALACVLSSCCDSYPDGSTESAYGHGLRLSLGCRTKRPRRRRPAGRSAFGARAACDHEPAAATGPRIGLSAVPAARRRSHCGHRILGHDATALAPKRATRPKQKEPSPKRKRDPKVAPVLVRGPGYDDGEILTPGVVAELFAVTPRTIRRWADAGKLPSFRTVGGWPRFRWGDIPRSVARDNS
jgi:MerR family regulatory protein